jgi:uncharacterized membrane protein YqjE
MSEDNNHTPGIGALAGRLVRTVLGAFHNRFELFAVEWQEERARLAELLAWVGAFLFLAIMTVVLLTATIIFLFPEGARVYATAGFTMVYLTGAIITWRAVRSLLKREPFAESVDQGKKDREWLKSFH